MVSSNRHTTIMNKRSHAKKKQAINTTVNDCKTVFVSGLRSDVNTNDLRNYFTGCIKVTIKQCRARSHLKYATDAPTPS